ncbi:sodium-independent sulfate anion transporter-like [Adelges cooleyi]|uniref:sodium-independent sulfate anion transporter-like n=1 Tax=Adelges cooleyi TaxID=133065 RepID=UPI002180036F|nr:sodium-independent sulfate anion transporter-like [Adelges cooleyi]
MDNPSFKNDNNYELRQETTENNDRLRQLDDREIVLTIENLELTPQNQRNHFRKRNVHQWPSTIADYSVAKLYILQWLPEYSSTKFVGDLLAGLTIGLTVIPQSMALASIAGLPPQYGLYSSFVSPLVYALFGTSKAVTMGPSAIVALLTYNAIRDRGPAYATLLCFLSGSVQLLMSFTGMGMIMKFISEPVFKGFTSAVGILIICSQLKDLTGTKGHGATLYQMLSSFSGDIKNLSFGDTAIGIVCIITLQILKSLSIIRVGSKIKELQTPTHKFINNSLWIVGAFRNMFVVILCSAIGYHYVKHSNHDITSSVKPPIPFKVIDKIPVGLPQLSWPEFNRNVDGRVEGLYEMISNMGLSVIVVPLISLLENISLCRRFADGKLVDTNQELLALGLSNLGTSFVHGFPVTGALARGSLNYASGVQTPLGGLYTGLSVMAGLIFLTPYFYYIPKASLASVIIATSFCMIDVESVKRIYKSKKKDLLLGLFTFFACLVFPLEMGVVAGIVFDIGFILHSAAKPKITVQMQKSPDDVKYLLMTPDRYLIFPSIEYVSKLIASHNCTEKIPVVIDGTKIFEADFTTANAFSILSKDLGRNGQKMYMYNLKSSVINVFKGIKNNSISICSDKKEIEEQLKNQMIALQTAGKVVTRSNLI